jgi:hypothetical protein
MRPHEIVTFWGNQDAKFANEEVLYESEQVMIVNFKMCCNDPNMRRVEWVGSNLPHLVKMQFDYIHKSNGNYIYIGKVDRLKIIKITRGMAEMELVILKLNDSSSSDWKKEWRYPCSTKKDVCTMRKWQLIKYEDLVKKVVILKDYGRELQAENW